MFKKRASERIKTKNGLRCMIWTHLEESRPRAVLLEEVVHRCKVVYGEDENVLREIRAIFNREILGNECSVFNATETPKGIVLRRDSLTLKAILGVALSFKDAFQATRAT
uniref:THUMP domain-containing protein n=1 Tax=Steinernema glaseri TaxID=37863 RepID=A0A1I8ASC0_9BILA